MPAIDDQRFMINSLIAKVKRISEAAAKFEQEQSPRNKALFKVMVEKVDDMFEAFQDNIVKIAAYNAKNSVQEDLDGTLIKVFEDEYYKCRAIAEVYIEERIGDENAVANVSTHSHGPAPQVQLPKIKLPEFGGEITEWQNFSDIFNVTVHRNESLTPIQRHVYLRSALTGEALALVQNLPLTEANYPVCWDTLARRYDNTHLLTTRYLDTLFDLPATSPNPVHIRSFSGKIIEATGALKALGYKVEEWAVPLLYMFRKKLHSRLRETWEETVLLEPAPSIKLFLAFLGEQAQILEAAHPPQEQGSSRRSNRGKQDQAKGVKAFNMSAAASPCARCSNQHELVDCGTFRRERVPDRIQFVKSRKLCLACLSSGHFADKCSRKTPCKHCSGNHHSLLHLNRKTQDQSHGNSSATDPPPPSSQPAPSGGSGNAVTSMQIFTASPKGEVIVATAIAQVVDQRGRYQDVRLLIDPGSEASFISRSCLQRLGLKPSTTDVPVLGMGQTSLGICREKVECRFKPAQTVEIHVSALVVDFITRTPSSVLPPLDPERLGVKQLADPGYFRPSPVDILLGAEWFAYVMVGEPQRGPPGSPSLIESIWGYCLIGRHGPAAVKVRSLLNVQEDDLGKILHRFWEIEEPPSIPIISKEDQECERLYVDSVRRQPDGRYVVSLPFLPDAPELGDSRQSALRRFLQLEKKLNGNSALREEYAKFMADYLDQGHMRRVSAPPPEKHYYIPHHCIFRTDTEGRMEKFRVVFDSSMNTKEGPSLNQTLYKGPKLQADIVDILVRARMFEILLIADVRQMYRNIAMCEEHQNMQRILWRFNGNEPLSEFCLTTLTYGVSSSPFQAIRTLHQLVRDEGTHFPLAAATLMEDTFMDDVVKAVPTVADALTLQDQLIKLMARGRFELRKWRSNNPEVLRNIPEEHRAKPGSMQGFESHAEPNAKILGLVWRSSDDAFGYQVSSTVSHVTKRIISSEIAKIYDPIGFICPVVFVGKCLLRKLWETGLDWDDAPPTELCDRWRRLQEELPLLNSFAVPRCLQLDKARRVQLHGFADASESGFAGVIYLRCEFPSGEVQVSLIMAKSKVAPVKSCSLPRLELCGIWLVTRLIHRVKALIEPHKSIEAIVVWSDSTVALHWVKSPPHRWKTFVANRVSLCQQNVPPQCYRHVPTAANPADCASRGLLPSEILNHPMWVGGPDWLKEPPESWPVLPTITPTDDNLAESKSSGVLVTTVKLERPCSEVFRRFSSLTYLLRVVGWARRFIHNRLMVPYKRVERLKGALTHKEITAALAACVRLVQKDAFSEDILRIQSKRSATRKLRRLVPFLDDKSIIRVGGRLRHANIAEGRKHPIVLPRQHPFTLLIIDFYHELYSHPGLSNLHAIILRSFWIQAGRAAIYTRISKCMECFRTQPRSLEPQMADLPLERVNPGKPFSVTGVDYAGPLLITMGKVRKAKVLKAYICLFVCFKTKAVHLELASELTTESFLAALKRFIARRGSVQMLFSDCGTNFVGAKRRLEEWASLVDSENYNDAVTRLASPRGIEWQMNPPSSPHFGGIWEANVKSAKRLLMRTVGNQVLTYEELLTVLTQVEATLNSRPLVPLSNDPTDLQALTPGHFLFMEAPVALEEPELPLDVPLRDRWMLLRQMVQSFWHRWSSDYLNTLQQRNKWTNPAPNLQEGMLVLIKEDNTSPLRWKMGRITRTFPGDDDQVRVAEVQTAHGLLKRSTVKLCPLPIY